MPVLCLSALDPSLSSLCSTLDHRRLPLKSKFPCLSNPSESQGLWQLRSDFQRTRLGNGRSGVAQWGASLSDVSSSLEKKSFDDAFFILNPAMSEAGAPPGLTKSHVV